MAHVEMVRAELKTVESESKRIEALANTGSVSQKVSIEIQGKWEATQAALKVAEADWEAAKSAVEVARKTLEETRVLLDYGTLKAPFNGVVTARHVELGDYVGQQTGAGTKRQPLFVVSDSSKVRVCVDVPERDAVWTDAGDAMEVQFSALPGKNLKGRISRAAKALDIETRSMRVEMDVENEDGLLLPGMFGKAVITMEHRTALVLPSGAIRVNESGQNSHVYVVNADSTISHVPVVTGWDDGHDIEIVSGLTGSETVVGAMLGRLEPGQEVQVLKD